MIGRRMNKTIKEVTMNRNTAIWGTLAGIGTGAAVMYFLDPDRGARRRALVRDKVNSKALRASKAISATKEHLANKGYGMVKEAESLLDLPAANEDRDSETKDERERDMNTRGEMSSH